MDTQIDPAQRRAAELVSAVYNRVDVRGILEGDALGESIEIIATALVQARRAALEEARRAIIKLYDEAHTESANYYTALLDAGLALDRLREGVENTHVR